MRNLLIAGNWKMNAGPTEAKTLSENLVKNLKGQNPESDILVCPPYVSIYAASEALKETPVHIGAQNVSTEDNGAFTGEISTEMLKDAGCTFVITGHSERREYYNEYDKLVAKKTKKAISSGLKTIACVGEKLEDRKNGNQQNIVLNQIDAITNVLTPDLAIDLTIAYEPVWAIGTGETATPDQAQEMHKFIRSLLAERLSPDLSQTIRILYGGSMKPGNAEELLSQSDVDGGLIGGASLQADSFVQIISIAEQISS